MNGQAARQVWMSWNPHSLSKKTSTFPRCPCVSRPKKREKSEGGWMSSSRWLHTGPSTCFTQGTENGGGSLFSQPHGEVLLNFPLYSPILWLPSLAHSEWVFLCVGKARLTGKSMLYFVIKQILFLPCMLCFYLESLPLCETSTWNENLHACARIMPSALSLHFKPSCSLPLVFMQEIRQHSATVSLLCHGHQAWSLLCFSTCHPWIPLCIRPSFWFLSSPGHLVWAALNLHNLLHLLSLGISLQTQEPIWYLQDDETSFWPRLYCCTSTWSSMSCFFY